MSPEAGTEGEAPNSGLEKKNLGQGVLGLNLDSPLDSVMTEGFVLSSGLVKLIKFCDELCVEILEQGIQRCDDAGMDVHR